MRDFRKPTHIVRQVNIRSWHSQRTDLLPGNAILFVRAQRIDPLRLDRGTATRERTPKPVRFVRRMTMPRRRSRSGTSPKQALGQAIGLLVGEVVIGVIATVLGVLNHVAWVLVLVLVGVGLNVSVFAAFVLRFRDDAAAALRWWGPRGLLAMMAASIPTYVALAIAAARMKHGS